MNYRLAAALVGILVFLDILRKGVERPMRSRVCEVHEERLVLIGILLDFPYGPVRKGLRDIVSLRHFPDRHFALDQAERIEVIHDPVNGAVMGIEAPVHRIVGKVGERLMEDLVIEPGALVLTKRSLGHVPFSYH